VKTTGAADNPCAPWRRKVRVLSTSRRMRSATPTLPVCPRQASRHQMQVACHPGCQPTTAAICSCRRGTGAACISSVPCWFHHVEKAACTCGLRFHITRVRCCYCSTGVPNIHLCHATQRFGQRPVSPPHNCPRVVREGFTDDALKWFPHHDFFNTLLLGQQPWFSATDTSGWHSLRCCGSPDIGTTAAEDGNDDTRAGWATGRARST
jgi:hypothetical protein